MQGEKSNQSRKGWIRQELSFFPLSPELNFTGAVAGKTEGGRQKRRGRRGFSHA